MLGLNINALSKSNVIRSPFFISECILAVWVVISFEKAFSNFFRLEELFLEYSKYIVRIFS